MKKLIVILLFSLGFCVHAQQNVSAPRKFALVIGNGNYTSITKLNNPGNDALDIKKALEDLGWNVDVLQDANQEQIDDAVIKLRNSLSASRNSYGFVFYAGHAVQDNGINYLIPIEANIPGASYLKSRAVSVQFLLDELNNAGNELNIVVLDACRDNPFSWNRGGNRGLAAFADRQPANSIIAFATSAGSVAADGEGRNGLYTTHLLNNLKTPGISVQELFNKTGADVINASGGKQHPALYSQFFEAAYLGSKSEPNPNPNPSPSPNSLVSLYEQLVHATGTGTVTVTQDTMLTSPVTIAIALSLTLRGDKEGRTITGAGYTVDGFSYPSSIIVERGVTLTLENIALFGVNVNVKQGGTLVMNNASTITGCLSCGVYVEGGTFIMNKGSGITNNGSSGVIVFGGIFTMNGGRIAGNNDKWGGGVNIDNKGTFNMNDGYIENNIASELGGGVYINNNSIFIMRGGNIVSNTAEDGGGVFVNNNSSFNIQYGGYISKNRADSRGGGVFVSSNSVFKMASNWNDNGWIGGSDAGSRANTAKAGSAVYNDSVSRNKEHNKGVIKF